MSDPQFLDLSGCAAKLGVHERAMRKAARADGFPAPAGRDGAPYWRDRDVLTWASSARSTAVGSGAAAVLARCGRAGKLPRHRTSAAAVLPRRRRAALRHRIGHGRIVWRCDDPIMLVLADVFDDDIDADVVVGVDPDLGLDGPGLRSHNLAAPARATSRQGNDWLSWTDLVRVLGQPMPYWPLALRDPDLIAAWEPGATPVTAPAQPALDSAPLLRMAAMFNPSHATHRTLINLVRVDQYRATHSTVHDLELTAEVIARAGTPPEQLVVYAARPLSWTTPRPTMTTSTS